MAITGTQKEIDEAKVTTLGVGYIPVSAVVVRPEKFLKRLLNIGTQCLVWFVLLSLGIGVVGIGFRIIKWALAAIA